MKFPSIAFVKELGSQNNFEMSSFNQPHNKIYLCCHSAVN